VARQRRLYLICYDIAEDPKRLNRVARYLSKFAFRVQYSVFVVGSFFEHSLEGVLRGLAAIIDPRKDDVRCYPLPALLSAAGSGGGGVAGSADVSRRHFVHPRWPERVAAGGGNATTGREARGFVRDVTGARWRGAAVFARRRPVLVRRRTV